MEEEIRDAEAQTDLRENETQTAAFDLIQPPSWMFVNIEPWVFEERYGMRRRPHREQAADGDRELFARDKEIVPVRMNPMVFPNRVEKEWHIPSLEELTEQRDFMEPFKNLLLKELAELEPRLKIKVNVEEWLQGDFIAMTDAYARRATRSTKGRSIARAVPRQRHYSVQVGKHRRVLTPRCDPTLVVKLERLTAIVLFQRCLRGRAAQISVLETRERCIGLYEQLNQLERCEEVKEPESTRKDKLWGAKCVVSVNLSNWLDAIVIPEFKFKTE
ncbi:hypothetical protein SELMODRAFT_412980 [Selaginella moellendorffii]|uniref:Uncharacterized protein n=1 Tax=Selaginella moellendorffii TaxID=88036 RepID=D8RMY9_SELML|nr:uncharacterized protein LOC9650842 isoform X1 [Selaginella moellendorffii]EFJ26620.1 hypothetical protein SELMODRAFT_412980 [Selaginella moellendorffii]|eukprot:XP_002972534.1 uncharacterized protein LOC9650842 isoform X1 [Selaginella moellendorffii]